MCVAMYTKLALSSLLEAAAANYGIVDDKSSALLAIFGMLVGTVSLGNGDALGDRVRDYGE